MKKLNEAQKDEIKKLLSEFMDLIDKDELIGIAIVAVKDEVNSMSAHEGLFVPCTFLELELLKLRLLNTVMTQRYAHG